MSIEDEDDMNMDNGYAFTYLFALLVRLLFDGNGLID